MNLRRFLIVGIPIAVAFCLGLLITDPTAAQIRLPGGLERGDLIQDVVPAQPKVGPVGRYQGSVVQGVPWLFDTATGECWVGNPGNPDKGWNHFISPPHK